MGIVLKTLDGGLLRIDGRIAAVLRNFNTKETDARTEASFGKPSFRVVIDHPRKRFAACVLNNAQLDKSENIKLLELRKAGIVRGD